MSANHTPENVAVEYELCDELVHPIGEVTEAYLKPDSPHPFLVGLADGGIVLRASRPPLQRGELMQRVVSGQLDDPNEYYKVIRARPYAGAEDPSQLEAFGIPAEAVAQGGVWEVITSSAVSSPDRTRSGDKVWNERVTRRMYAYLAGYRGWGYDWRTCTLAAPQAQDASHAELIESPFQAYEQHAISVVARQTHYIHLAAEAFQGDGVGFQEMMQAMLMKRYDSWLGSDKLGQSDGRTLDTNRYGYALLPRTTDHAPRELPGYQSVFRTAYQQAAQAGGLIEEAYAWQSAHPIDPLYVEGTGIFHGPDVTNGPEWCPTLNRGGWYPPVSHEEFMNRAALQAAGKGVAGIAVRNR